MNNEQLSHGKGYSAASDQSDKLLHSPTRAPAKVEVWQENAIDLRRVLSIDLRHRCFHRPMYFLIVFSMDRVHREADNANNFLDCGIRARGRGHGP